MSTFTERTVTNAKMPFRHELRSQEALWLAFATLVMVFGFAALFFTKTEALGETEQLMVQKKVINLNAMNNPAELRDVMRSLYPDGKDQRFVAEAIFNRVQAGEIPNVGTLNKLKVPAHEIEQKGGESLKARLENSWKQIGLSPKLVVQERKAPKPFPSVARHREGPFRISGSVRDATGNPLSGTLVTLDSDVRRDTVRTDVSGQFVFEGLGANRDYYVLAMKPGVEFRRVRHLTLRDHEEAHFSAQPHTIRLIESAVFSRLKPQVVVRGPNDFTHALFLFGGLFMALFWLVHVAWRFRQFNGDPYILPVLMMLTGLGLLMMFAIPDPLRDLLRGWDTVLAIGVGLVLFTVLSLTDIQHWGYDYSETGNRSFWWLGGAALISLLLLTIGFGPEGSTARVNLRMFLFFGPEIQPVEIIKLFLLIFFAGYLARKWQFIRQLDAHLPKWVEWAGIRLPNLKAMLPILFGVAFALVFFYLQKDLGPALVICTTFLVLYAFTRHHWAALGLGLVLLIAGFWVMYQLNPTVGSRIEMWLSPWDNEADGGDHLAYSFWSLAAGGWFGQGLGDGSPADTPAAHTDMILSAIGEELGYFGLAAVFLLYAIYFHRGLMIALRTDARFSLFLGLGIVASTMIQLVLIAGGVFGLLPLTGVVSPFLSYGKVAVVMHLVFAGLLMSLSNQNPSEQFRQIQEKDFGRPIQALRYAFLVLALLVLGRVGYLQLIQADDVSLKQALVIQSDGLKSYTYNPRMLRIRDALPLGNIYDRNGIPLAASDTSAFTSFKKTYRELGFPLSKNELLAPKRHYPFEALTFYLLGDLNNRVKWNAPNGLYAENRYLSTLRGYDNKPVARRITHRLADGTDTTYTVVKFDYSPLLPFLRGADPKNADKILNTKRDLKLTIDVRLQQKVAEVLRLKTAQMGLQKKNQVVSAVVLDAKKGDLLASVSYPLPHEVFISPSLAQSKVSLFDHGLYASKAPGSTLKVATAMAAFRRGGDGAANWTVLVDQRNRWAQFFRLGEPSGVVDMEKAVVYSGNVYFASLAADRVGPEGMLYVLDAFGFVVRNSAFEKQQKLERLYANNLRNLAQAGFGQGEIVGAPINVARMAATVANEGKAVEPRFFLEETTFVGEPKTILTTGQAALLKNMMRKVVTTGTAKSIAGNRSSISGKTGTAQQTGHLDHAWFVCFAPDGKGGHLVVAVLAEESGKHGGEVAPIAGAIIDAARNLGLIK